MASVPGGQAQRPAVHTAGGMHSLLDVHGDDSGFEWAALVSVGKRRMVGSSRGHTHPASIARPYTRWLLSRMM